MKRKRHQNKPLNSSVVMNKVSSTMVDVVIPVYGRFDLLDKCLDSIPSACYGLNYSVTLVDNKSPEGTDYYDKLRGSGYKLFKNKENQGFPLACNKGTQQGKSPLIFFLNTDIVLHPGSIVSLVKTLDDPSIGAVGMKLLFPEECAYKDMVGKVQHVGLSTNIGGEIIHHLLGWSADHPKVMRVREVYAITGAAFMVRRSLFEKAGGFYYGYGLGCYEDVDMCLSVRELGYNIVVDINSVGTHHAGASASAYNIAYPLTQNMDIFKARWGSKLQYTEWMVW